MQPETRRPHSWDPDRYLAYADERSRPFVDMIAQIRATSPRTVVDLGCGPGNLTALLAARWPDADVLGLDSSPEMIATARARADDVGYEQADLREWIRAAQGDPVDVVVSNATLQWLPEHLDLLPGLVAAVRPGGWLAFQVPGNFEEPSHTIRRELAAEDAYAPHVEGVAHPSSHEGTAYLDALIRLGCEVNAWETTYLHVLDGADDPDPVFTWVSATGARPTLQALPADLRGTFEDEFRRRLALAYPVRADGGVVLPFRRIFAVAQVPDGDRR